MATKEAKTEKLENTEEPKVTDPWKIMKKIYVRPGYSYDEGMLYVSVNSHNYLVPKGKESEVPLPIYNELIRSNLAIERFERAKAASSQRAQNINTTDTI